MFLTLILCVAFLCCLFAFSSVGMVKAALESLNGDDLFGSQGASWSVIYADIDSHNRNRTIFDTILPRESNSKVYATCLLLWSLMCCALFYTASQIKRHLISHMRAWSFSLLSVRFMSSCDWFVSSGSPFYYFLSASTVYQPVLV